MDVIEILKNKKGFIAALDQSGGSSTKTLKNYGIDESLITSEEVMYKYIHEMRTRVITNESFSSDKIIGVILFKHTMENKIGDLYTADYLNNKGILSFLKVDVGLAEECDGVQLLKDIPDLDSICENAKKYHIIGTKMRSVIKEYNEYGIKKVIEQQFKLAKIIISHGLIPIIEPEVDINSPYKKQIETFMKKEIMRALDKCSSEDYLMFKFTIPDIPNYYDELLRKKNVLRIVALSGGYERSVAVEKLKENKKMIASFSRALLEGLSASDSDEEFTNKLASSIDEIYKASVSK